MSASVSALEKQFGPLDAVYTADASSVFNLQRALAARTNPGAPSGENVKAEIARWRH